MKSIKGILGYSTFDDLEKSIDKSIIDNILTPSSETETNIVSRIKDASTTLDDFWQELTLEEKAQILFLA